MEEISSRIRGLDAKILAQSALLAVLVLEQWPKAADRLERCNFICQWIERAYGNMLISEYDQSFLKKTIAEVEAMLLGK